MQNRLLGHRVREITYSELQDKQKVNICNPIGLAASEGNGMRGEEGARRGGLMPGGEDNVIQLCAKNTTKGVDMTYQTGMGGRPVSAGLGLRAPWMAAMLLAAGVLAGPVAQAAPCSATNTLFAAADGLPAASGLDWANATTLQHALVIANGGSGNQCYEIRIKQGVYKPTATTDADPRSATFSINRPVRLLGGYTGVSPTDRVVDPVNTVLSGDLDDNDTVGPIGNNSYNVILIGGLDTTQGNGQYTSANPADATYTMISGVTITGGLADRVTPPALPAFPNNSGAGLFCNGVASPKECSPHILNTLFKGNKALTLGGAIHSFARFGVSSPLIENSTFSENQADGGGGAIYNQADGITGISSPRIKNTTFSNNSTLAAGGAMANVSRASGISESKISDSTFQGNVAVTLGGAIYNFTMQGISSPVISASSFSSNQAQSGGAVYSKGQSASGFSSPVITNSAFITNKAIGGDGGAIVNKGQSSGTSSAYIAGSTFTGNMATASGGAIQNDGATGVNATAITNSTFTGNQANAGGALLNFSANASVHPVILYSTFHGNTATEGGAMYNAGLGNPQIIASILWGNHTAPGGPQMHSPVSATAATVSHSVVAGGYAGTGNLSGNPMLGTLQTNGGPTMTLLPGAGSSAIDSADCAAVAALAASFATTLDQRGSTRPIGSACDIGAVEVTQYGLTLAVQNNAPGVIGNNVTPTEAPIGASTAPVCTASSCGPLMYPEHGVVHLTAQAQTGSAFTGWSDACSGTTTACSVTMDSAKSATAAFDAFSLAVATPPMGLYGTAYSQASAVTLTGGVAPYTLAVSNAPAGVQVNFNSTNGTVEISAPANLAAGAYALNVVATDSNGSTTQPTPVTVVITPVVLTVTANDVASVEGAPLPALTASYSGFQNGETVAALATPATVTTTATSTSPVGTYPIIASGAISNNYTFTYVQGTLSITPSLHSLGGTVSGLAAGTSVILQNNGGDTLTLGANGAFTFVSPVPHGSAYSVTVLTQPAGQTCSVQQGVGTMGTANVSNVTVACLANLSITTTSLGNLQVQKPYSLALAASGGLPPYTWTATDPAKPLPAGLSLSAAGVLSGTPTTAGDYTSLVTITDSSAAPQAVTLRVTTAKAAGVPVSQEYSGKVAEAAAVTPVPTLSEWALWLLSAVMAAVSLGWMRRRGDRGG